MLWFSSNDFLSGQGYFQLKITFEVILFAPKTIQKNFNAQTWVSTLRRIRKRTATQGNRQKLKICRPVLGPFSTLVVDQLKLFWVVIAPGGNSLAENPNRTLLLNCVLEIQLCQDDFKSCYKSSITVKLAVPILGCYQKRFQYFK